MPAPGIWPAILRILPEGKKRVADLGCEDERWSFPEYEIYRCDMERYPEISDMVLADLNKDFPFRDQSFDGVMAVELIEHLENPRHFIRECKRITRDFILITTPNCCSPESKRLFQKDGVFKYFEHHGICYKPYGHITPLFPWMFHIMANDYELKIEKETYNNPEEEIYIVLMRK